jgi:hypothetical protein
LIWDYLPILILSPFIKDKRIQTFVACLPVGRFVVPLRGFKIIDY